MYTVIPLMQLFAASVVSRVLREDLLLSPFKFLLRLWLDTLILIRPIKRVTNINTQYKIIENYSSLGTAFKVI